MASEDELLLLQATAQSLNVCARDICDAGRTQIAAGSRTVLGVGPGSFTSFVQRPLFLALTLWLARSAPVRLVNQITGQLKVRFDVCGRVNGLKADWAGSVTATLKMIYSAAKGEKES